MKIVLNKSVDNLGTVGQVVEVKDGYARNFLFPRGFAVSATPSNVRVIERLKAKEIEKEKETLAKARELAARIAGLALVIEARCGEDDKLYGSVSAAEIHEALGRSGVEADRKNVLLKRPIKKTGSYQAEVRCAIGLKAPLKISVIKKKD